MRIPMQKYREQMLDILEKLIAIPSVKQPPQLNMPYGKPVFEALMFMLDAAEHMDLESVNLFGHMGYASYGEGKETLALLTHLDVVPPGEGWDTDPFTAVRKDGRIYAAARWTTRARQWPRCLRCMPSKRTASRSTNRCA